MVNVYPEFRRGAFGKWLISIENLNSKNEQEFN